MIRGIFFDAAGVFYDRKETTGTFARRRLVELGYPPELSKENNARKKELHLLATEGRLSHETYWDQVLALHRVDDLTLRAKLRKEILDHTFDVFAYPGGKEALAGLGARGYRLGIVTDTIYPFDWKMAWLEKVGVAQYIDVIACSSALGAHKPEPEMYLNALEQAGLKPAQAAFVGHDAGELKGARQAGLATVAVNYDPEAKADYYAGSLAGLLDLPIFQLLQVHVESL